MLQVIYEFFESIGKARAAAELTRMGYVKEAQAIMLNQSA